MSDILRRLLPLGALNDAIPVLLYTYVCGSPKMPEIKAARYASGGRLAEQMKRLSGEIARFTATPSGKNFRKRLEEIDVCLSPKIAGFSKQYSGLSQLLSQLAAILSSVINTFAPADRKTIQSRALIMLYCQLAKPKAQLETRAISELTILLGHAYKAAGTPKEVEPRTLENRILRFRKKAPREVVWLEDLVRKHGLPTPKPLAAILLLHLPFSSPTT